MRPLLVLLLLALCLPACAANGDLYGLCVTPYWPEVPNHGVCYNEKVADDIQALGAKWMRCEFMCAKDGSMDYAGWDEITARAKAHKLNIIGLLDYGTIQGSDKKEWATPEYADRFVKRATEIVNRYKNSVRIWEIWNEENFSQFRLDPEPFANLLARTYRAIKAVDNRAIVCVGGLAGCWSCENNDCAAQYLAEIYEAKATKEFKKERGFYPFDAVGNHPYAWDQPPAAYLEKSIRENVLGVMERYGDGKKPIYITESGWDVEPGSPTKMGPKLEENLINQAKWLTDMYKMAAEMKRKDGSPVINILCWYCYDAPGGMGLNEFASDKKRPAYNAYQKLATHPNHLRR